MYSFLRAATWLVLLLSLGCEGSMAHRWWSGPNVQIGFIEWNGRARHFTSKDGIPVVAQAGPRSGYAVELSGFWLANRSLFLTIRADWISEIAEDQDSSALQLQLHDIELTSSDEKPREVSNFVLRSAGGDESLPSGRMLLPESSLSIQAREDLARGDKVSLTLRILIAGEPIEDLRFVGEIGGY